MNELARIYPTTTGQTSTFGSPVDVDPLTALLDDVKRTQGIIDYLTNYIQQLTPTQLFYPTSTTDQLEQETTRYGKPTKPNQQINPNNQGQSTSTPFLEIKRQRQTKTHQQIPPSVHPAVTTLQAERRHLATICHQAISLGIKLDYIDFSRQQADSLLTAMAHLAIALNLDPTDPTIANKIAQALDAATNPNPTASSASS